MRPARVRPEEMWEWSDGAPEGVGFDITVPSLSEPGRDYRVMRLEVERCVIHTPPCQAWRHGDRDCRHLKRAVLVAEDPFRTFAIDVKEAWEAGGWRPDQRSEMAAAMYRSAGNALDQAEALERYRLRMEERARLSRSDLTAEAVEMFSVPFRATR